MGFNTDGYRVTGSDFSNENIETLRNHWKDFIRTIGDYPPKKYHGRGIVFTAGGLKYTTCLWISINRIRSLQCHLPIEVWFVGNEVSQEVIEEFKFLNVVFKNFFEIINPSSFTAAGFALKPLSILHSSFEEVLFLDADNIPLIDPSILFSHSGYLEHGAMFWPDYWKTEATNPIWEIIEASPSQEPEQESGQLLINKKRCWRELELTNYFNKHGKYYYRLLYGDKDTFKISWIALNKSYHMIKIDPGSCGTIVNNIFFGNTIVQYNDEGHVAFLHRNLLKWDITGRAERAWIYTKAFATSAKNKGYVFRDLSSMSYLDIKGDVLLEKSGTEIVKLEIYCLAILDEWRNSSTFSNYLRYCYIQQNRFKDKSEFDIKCYF